MKSYLLKKAQADVPVKATCRKYGTGNSTFYQWREKYGGMDTSDIKLRKIEAENHKPKQMLAELGLKSQSQE
ncbi:transposase [Snodgrassella alvi]|uniref:transposase n=1 Tax=Snodgrassella alvi TaxID=1196083 RepID=UPI0035A3BB5B